MRPLTRLSPPRRSPKAKRLPTRKARLFLDSLEERVVPSVTTIEDFSGDLSAYRTIYRYEPSAAIIPNAGHDGVANALLKQDGYEWMMREDGGSAVHQGDTIDVWTQFSGNVDGRIYFAFGAHPYGLVHSPFSDGHTLALVLAGNTGQMMFEANDVTTGQYRGLQLAPHVVGSPVAQSYSPDTWYQMEVVWGSGGSLTGNLYDASGNLLNSVTATDNAISSGGIGFRGFGSDKYFDTVQVNDGTSPGGIHHGGAVRGALAIRHAPLNPADFQHNSQPTGPNGGTGTPVPYDYASVQGTGRDIELRAFNSLSQIAIDTGRGLVALAGANTSANDGTLQVSWGPAQYSGSGPVAPETPLLAQYIFRQLPGQATTLLGSSDVKHFFSTVSSDFQNLNPGETDPYGSSLNGTQSLMLPGSDLDPVSGEMHRPSHFSRVDDMGDGFDIYVPHSHPDPFEHRLTVNIADLDPSQNPDGTRWFLMGNLWVAGDDNVDNNSRWVEFVPHLNGSSFTFTYPNGSTGQLNFRTIPGLVVGPSVTSSTPNGNVLAPVDTVTVTFDSAIDPTTFTPAQVHVFNGPNGAITVNDVEPTDNTDTTFAITFDAQSANGNYTMTIGPDIYDQNGNPMVTDYIVNFTIVPANILVVNGGFETGNFSGWTTLPADTGSLFGVVSGSAHTGTYAAQFGAVVEDHSDFIYQDIATDPGATYTISFWVRDDGGGPSEIIATWGGATLLDLEDPAPFGYTQYSFTMTASDSSTRLELGGYQVPSYFYIDDVIVAPSGSPSPSGGLGTTNDPTLAQTGVAATHIVPLAPPSITATTLAAIHPLAAQGDTTFATPAKPWEPASVISPVVAPEPVQNAQDPLSILADNPIL